MAPLFAYALLIVTRDEAKLGFIPEFEENVQIYSIRKSFPRFLKLIFRMTRVFTTEGVRLRKIHRKASALQLSAFAITGSKGGSWFEPRSWVHLF